MNFCMKHVSWRFTIPANQTVKNVLIAPLLCMLQSSYFPIKTIYR
jgi:hypothetical protein